MTMKLPKINNTHLFWGVYITFLFVLLPQAAWTIGQFQDMTGTQWAFMGVTASPLAWSLAAVIEATIAIVTHRLNVHWMEMPKRYKADDMAKKRFAYRWLNVYAVTLIVAMLISAVANYTHVVQFTNPALQVFKNSAWAVQVYQLIFGFALPGVSFVFARTLSTMRESEQEDDPAFAKAKADLKEANSNIRSLEQSIRQTEQQYSAKLKETEHLLYESEQRYRAVGDVVRWLFGKEEVLAERIRGIRTSFPNLSQNGIAQLLGCSVSTVNDALKGHRAELPDIVDVNP
jgi:DNA-binding transcriptional regulator YiaG